MNCVAVVTGSFSGAVAQTDKGEFQKLTHVLRCRGNRPLRVAIHRVVAFGGGNSTKEVARRVDVLFRRREQWVRIDARESDGVFSGTVHDRERIREESGRQNGYE